MSVLFIEYPKCTTCKKAKKFLTENNIEFIDRHIAEENPTKDELKNWISKSGLGINKFFNTSGVLYREMQLKDKVNVPVYYTHLRAHQTSLNLVCRLHLEKKKCGWGGGGG
ncbi:hypothetical protein GNF83_23430, partial [Clostridium perfringens]|nr:hypothetical protein [Clostridium perfringens]